MASVNLEMPPMDYGIRTGNQEVELNAVKGQMGSKTRGVSLTWNDLWVTVSTRKSGRKAILQGLTGYARPSELLAVMGPSGCGKSTFLDALAGRLDFSTRQSGVILINGHKQKLSYGTCAYLTQDETLLATLTVKEAVYYSAQLQLPDSMTKSEKIQIAEQTIKEMGLQDAMNTRIGGWGNKGISGGEKRRLSICMEILTRPKLLFLDEPTSGLDSAASYYVMSGISRQKEGRTIVASIHQPSAEVFNLFHSLCLLSSGRIVYFGPASAAIQFFARNGFPCPRLQNPSDHFLKTINKDFDEDVEQGSAGRKPTEEVIDLLVNSYKSSEEYHEVQNQVAEICQQGGEILEKRSHANFTTQGLVLTRRSSVNMFRDLGYYWMRFATYVAIALGLGSIYYDLGSNYRSVEERGLMVAFVVSFMTFMTVGGFPSFVEDMKVFQRENLNGHYGCCTFVIGNTLSSIPYVLLISFVPGAIAYFLSGFQNGFGHFIYFELVLFTSMMIVESLMMNVAAIVPNFLMGIVVGAGIQGLQILSGGFFQLPSELPDPIWKYPLYYMSFHKYAYQGMFKNEFEGLKFTDDQFGKNRIMSGEDILRERWQAEMAYSKWVDLAILVGTLILYRLVFLLIIKTNEKVVHARKASTSILSNRSSQIMAKSLPASPLHGLTSFDDSPTING
ncbi:PREDICTED: ABC transporter G family member 11-like isoform X2 [Nicotiana attenuata]|uniref:Abc transporter g family member 11 n=1 Tax=Nicotiana attenuata TaxID=49451 RepID=A0A1J6JDI0_NICAT|nr:PREDICTED: ABC transporter G family member 11-like isoform X2 [Nicotiana attenuata]OIT07727.1 abc transporter g family member 11 [Nicotiana attenuata]